MSNPLTDLFQGIADAIRAKGGGTEKISPAAYPAEILALNVANTLEPKFASGSVETPMGSWKLSVDDYDFAAHPTYQGVYYWEITPAIFTLIKSDTYRVSWDRAVGIFQAAEKTIGTVLQDGLVLGNTGLLSGGDGVEYLIGYSATQDKNVILTRSTAQSHNISVFQPEAEQITVEHGMDGMPDLIVVYPNTGFYANDAFLSDCWIQSTWGMQSKYADRIPVLGALVCNGIYSTSESYGLDNMSESNRARGFAHCPDELTLRFGVSGNGGKSTLIPGCKYHWLAVKFD